MNKIKEKDLNEFQKKYINDNFSDKQTWEISDYLKIPRDTVSRYADHNGLRHGKDFKVTRKGGLTPEQSKYILENYHKMKNKEIMSILKINYDLLKKFANNNKLKKSDKMYFERAIATKEQLEYIRDKYTNTSLSKREIGKELGLTECQVSTIVTINKIKKNLNLAKKKYSKFLSYEHSQFILENYENMKNSDICSALNIDIIYLERYAKNHKLYKNPNYYDFKNKTGYFSEFIKKLQNEKYDVYRFLGNKKEIKIKDELLYLPISGKYKINQNYFHIIDNEWKAYWLGFLYADGCVRKTTHKNSNKKINTVSVNLNIIDKTHIEKFKNSIQSTHLIKDRDTKLNDTVYKSSQFILTNEKMTNDLIDKGCVPNKSLILTFPSTDKLPKKFQRDFIRGYFDGDGCIHINLEKKTTGFSILGTMEFVNKIKEIINNDCNINNGKISQKDNIYILSYTGLKNINDIYKYLYKNCNIYLERKLKKFNTLFCLD